MIADAPTITVDLADYADPADAALLVDLLDAYARDAAGGGQPLSDFAKKHLVGELATRPQAFSVLAFDGEQPVGLVNCIEGFSSFKCKPLVNVHDVAVLASHRGRGIAERMLAEAELWFLPLTSCSRMPNSSRTATVEMLFRSIRSIAA